jgi:hypothetical protein
VAIHCLAAGASLTIQAKEQKLRKIQQSLLVTLSKLYSYSYSQNIHHSKLQIGHGSLK